MAKFGIFSPAVIVAKVVLGEAKLNKVGPLRRLSNPEEGWCHVIRPGKGKAFLPPPSLSPPCPFFLNKSWINHMIYNKHHSRLAVGCGLADDLIMKVFTPPLGVCGLTCAACSE